MDFHTDILNRMRSSSYGRKYVASPSEVCRRQTKPGLRSAKAFISSRRATKPAMTGSSSAAFIRPMLTCAICRALIKPSPVIGRATRKDLRRRAPSGVELPEDHGGEDRQGNEQQGEQGRMTRHDRKGHDDAQRDEYPGRQGPAVFEVGENA